MQNVHSGYERETLVRFIKAREGSISEAYDMVCFEPAIPFLLLNHVDYCYEAYP